MILHDPIVVGVEDKRYSGRDYSKNIFRTKRRFPTEKIKKRKVNETVKRSNKKFTC